METKTETAAPEKLTITLTGARPIRIVKDAWPIIASAEDNWFDGEHECQANRKKSWKLIVRQHQGDGRTIVYGIYTYTTNFRAESSAATRGGEMLTVEGATDEEIGDTEAIIAAIYWVAEDMETRSGEEAFARLAHVCIADLPAAEIV